jgi:hypothetical protein
MLTDGTAAASFLPLLKQTVQAAGLGTVLTCCDNTGWPATKTLISQFQAAGGLPSIGRVTSHYYSGNPNSLLNVNIPVWETEAGYLSNPWSTTWYSNGGGGEGLTWANLIFTSVTQADVSAYLAWWGACTNADSSCLVNVSGGGAQASGRLWAYGLWSRYVKPGAQRLGTSGAPSGVLTAAFKNTDGSYAIVAINNGGSSASMTLSVSGISVSSATGYYMSNSVSSISTLGGVTVSGGAVSGSLPARSMVTFVLKTGAATASTSGSVSASTSRTSTASPPAGTCSARYAQCGGQGWAGPTCCVAGTTCQYSNAYYSQCL